jgi:hypothetical protein
MPEHQRPLGLQVLVEPYAIPSARQQPLQPCLALVKRLAPQIVTVQLN